MEKSEIRELVKEFDAGIAWLKNDACMFGFDRSVHRIGFQLELTSDGEKELNNGDKERFKELQEIGEKLELEKIRLNHKFFIKWLKKED